MAGGRPTKFDPSRCEEITNYCLLGATDEELATFLDVTPATVYKWKNKHPEFVEAIKKGKEEADAQVVKSLYKRATGYTAKETKFATHEGEITDRVEYEKEVQPDTTAQIFWLKNRQRSKWMDVKRNENTGADGKPQQFEMTKDDREYLERLRDERNK